MKKIIVFLVSGCCSMILLMACGMREKGTEDIVAEPIKAGDEIDNSETGKTEETTDAVEQEIIYPKGYQINAIRFYEQDYVFLDKTLYKITSEQDAEELLKCEEAVGQKRDTYLFWGIWDTEHDLQIIRLDAEGSIFEVGELKEKYPPAALDFYGDILYIRYKLGNVEGYRISADGKIAGEASSEEMKLYNDENEAAEIRQNKPNDRESIQSFSHHIMEAGYSKEICGKEFLARHVQNGETGVEEFIVRSDGADTVLFTYYEDVFINREKVIYCSSAEKTRLSIYDMRKNESKDIYEFADGSFELLTVDDNQIYGIWRSIEQSKNFLVGIDMDNSKMRSYFETSDEQEYAIINNTIYYVDPVNGNVTGLSVKGG